MSVSSLALINPSKRRILAWVRANPGLALAAASGAFVGGWLAWLVYRAKFCGVFSRGLVIKGNEQYQFTQDDMLWLGRALLGEVTETSASWALPTTQRSGAAVLYALVNAYMLIPAKRATYSTLSSYVRAYCQPLSSRWASSSASGCIASPNLCTPTHLARRARISSKTWAELPVFVRTLVEQFVRGCLSNPIGGRTDWRAEGFGYRPADPVVVGGNVFGTSPNASMEGVRFA
jgi:hypothetical protein